MIFALERSLEVSFMITIQNRATIESTRLNFTIILVELINNSLRNIIRIQFCTFEMQDFLKIYISSYFGNARFLKDLLTTLYFK